MNSWFLFALDIPGGIRKGILILFFLCEILPRCALVCENYENDNISGNRTSISGIIPLGKIEKIPDSM